MKTSIMVLLILFEVAISSIIIPLENADTKICSNFMAYIPFVHYIYRLNPIICDLNDDGVNDLMYSNYVSYSYTSFLCAFFGRKEWPQFINEDMADVEIYDTFSNYYIDLCPNSIYINSEGDSFFVIMLRPSTPVSLEKYALIPLKLDCGNYLVDDIIINWFVNPSEFRVPIISRTMQLNYVVCDSLLMTFGIYAIRESVIVRYGVLLFVPLNTGSDTIDMFDSACYKGFYMINFYHYRPVCDFIYSPGDIDGDGYSDIMLLQNFHHSPGSVYYGDDAPIEIPTHIYYWFPSEVMPQTHILWGRPTWRGYIDSIYNDRSTTRYNTYLTLNGALRPATKKCDLNNDGFNDILIIAPSIAYSEGDIYSPSSTLVFPGDTIPGDTSKVYIIFGREHFPREVLDSLKNIVDITISSRHPNDMIQGPLAVGDYNGDSNQDILVGAASVYPYVAYLFLGNNEGEFPEFFDDADIKIQADSEHIYQYTGNWKYMITTLGAELGDLNNDGLDDIVLAIHRYKIRNMPPEPIKISLPFVYIFFNRRPTPSLLHPDTSVIDNPHDSICVKLSFKQPLALHTLLFTVSGDTFTIDSPQVVYNPAESLLCFIPSTEWDTSAMIPFCIERLEDTIGTAMRERWCVRFNDTTWNVSEPPKPQTLSLTCYPNPFNAEVRIKLRMPDAGDIKIDIYDISGKFIDHIYKSKLTAGWHELVWCPRISVPSGVYLLKVSAGGEVVVRRVVLVR